MLDNFSRDFPKFVKTTISEIFYSYKKHKNILIGKIILPIANCHNLTYFLINYNMILIFYNLPSKNLKK